MDNCIIRCYVSVINFNYVIQCTCMIKETTETWQLIIKLFYMIIYHMLVVVCCWHLCVSGEQKHWNCKLLDPRYLVYQMFDDSTGKHCMCVLDNGAGMSPRELNNWAIYRLSKFNRASTRQRFGFWFLNETMTAILSFHMYMYMLPYFQMYKSTLYISWLPVL